MKSIRKHVTCPWLQHLLLASERSERDIYRGNTIENQGCLFIQRASEASEADYQSCSIEISDIYIYICRYVCVRQKISPALLIT